MRIRLLVITLFLSLALPAFPQQVSKIIISGNKQTKSSLILDYLEIQEGDDIDSDSFLTDLEKAKNRLMKTSLFLSVDMVYETSGDKLTLYVNVKERWYYWFYPILEHADRNFAAFVHSKDLSRINYGLSFEKQNFRGRDEFLKLKLRFGFRSQFGVMYDVPKISVNSIHGFQISADYFNQKKVLVNVNDDKPVFFFDKNSRGLEELRLKAIWHINLNHYHKLHFLTEYQGFRFSETLDSVTPYYIHQKNQKNQYLSLKVKYNVDYRDDRYYPLKGFYGDASIEKKGLGLLNSAVDLLLFETNLAHYQPLSSKWYLSSEMWLKTHLLSQKHLPFLYSVVIGYKNFPRGYQYNMIQSAFGLGLNETFRYQLYKSPDYNLSFIPIEAFQPFNFTIYAYAFTDVAYTLPYKNMSANNTLSGKWLFSTGLGFDFVTYYDRSLGFHVAVTREKNFGIFVTFKSPLYKLI